MLCVVVGSNVLLVKWRGGGGNVGTCSWHKPRPGGLTKIQSEKRSARKPKLEIAIPHGILRANLYLSSPPSSATTATTTQLSVAGLTNPDAAQAFCQSTWEQKGLESSGFRFGSMEPCSNLSSCQSNFICKQTQKRGPHTSSQCRGHAGRPGSSFMITAMNPH